MTTDQFATPRPPGATGPSMEGLAGRLVLVQVHRIERGVSTTTGTADAVRCDIADLTTGETHHDSMLWGKVLVPQFDAGATYVGRISRGEPRPGMTAPWIFLPGDANDQGVASRFLAYQGQRNGAAATPPPQAPPLPPFVPQPVPPFTPPTDMPWAGTPEAQALAQTPAPAPQGDKPPWMV